MRRGGVRSIRRLCEDPGLAFRDWNIYEPRDFRRDERQLYNGRRLEEGIERIGRVGLRVGELIVGRGYNVEERDGTDFEGNVSRRQSTEMDFSGGIRKQYRGSIRSPQGFAGALRCLQSTIETASKWTSSLEFQTHSSGFNLRIAEKTSRTLKLLIP